MKITETTINACLKTLKQEAEYYLKNHSIEDLKKIENGIIAMYQHDEIYEYDISEVFIEEPMFQYVIYEKLFRDFIEEIQYDEYIGEDEEMEENEIMQWYQDARNQFIFYKLKNRRIKSLKGALKIIRTVGFWLPVMISIDGKWYSTHHLGAQDKNGNTLGVRF